MCLECLISVENKDTVDVVKKEHFARNCYEVSRRKVKSCQPIAQ